MQMEVELREVPLVSAPSGAKQRRTMTLDLAANKPMTLRLIHRANNTAPASPRSDSESSPDAAKGNCERCGCARCRLSSAHARAQRARSSSTTARSPRAASWCFVAPTSSIWLSRTARTNSSSPSAQLSAALVNRADVALAPATCLGRCTRRRPLTSGSNRIKRSASTRFSTRTCVVVVVVVVARRRCSICVCCQMNVYITPKDNNLVLKISLGERSDITKVMKVPPSTLVRDVCALLVAAYPPSTVDWGLIGKEKGAPALGAVAAHCAARQSRASLAARPRTAERVSKHQHGACAFVALFLVVVDNVCSTICCFVGATKLRRSTDARVCRSKRPRRSRRRASA